MTTSATPLAVDGVPVARIIALLRTRNTASVAWELDITVRAVHMALQLYRQHREAVDAEVEKAGEKGWAASHVRSDRGLRASFTAPANHEDCTP